jgi:hypothetical protein
MAEPVTNQLTVTLADGSRLRGTTSLKELSLRSEALGKLSVQFERIASVKFSKDRESVTVTLRNGDRIQAGFGDASLALSTIVGPVKVPLDKAMEIRVHAKSAGQSVEWEALPYPTAHNWGGPRGEPAVVDEDGLIVQGQPLRSVATFGAPLTVACEVMLERLTQNGSDLFIELIPTGLPKDSVVDKVPGVQRLHFALGDRNQLTLNRHQDGRWQTIWSSELPALDAQKPHRLELEIGAARFQVRVDGQLYEAEKIGVPFEEFHLQLWNWQPSSRWRVKELSVR